MRAKGFCILFFLLYMLLKLPFKLKLIQLVKKENIIQGKAVFHEEDYSIEINANSEKKTIKVPFPVIGVTDDNILVRISGPSGVYVEDHIKFEGESKEIEIDSDIIFHEILNNQEKVFDVLEIFVK